jgi:hypothetical protein
LIWALDGINGDQWRGARLALGYDIFKSGRRRQKTNKQQTENRPLKKKGLLSYIARRNCELRFFFGGCSRGVVEI